MTDNPAAPTEPLAGKQIALGILKFVGKLLVIAVVLAVHIRTWIVLPLAWVLSAFAFSMFFSIFGWDGDSATTVATWLGGLVTIVTIFVLGLLAWEGVWVPNCPHCGKAYKSGYDTCRACGRTR